jgi:hypothetical protein
MHLFINKFTVIRCNSSVLSGVGHEGEKGKPQKHSPQALELIEERRRKRKRV